MYDGMFLLSPPKLRQHNSSLSHIQKFNLIYMYILL